VTSGSSVDDVIGQILSTFVMAGLVPAIHDFVWFCAAKTWMPGHDGENNHRG
jgi:hypothetical protein